ncbi:MAG: efflux RND transporter periplasmic adaptor subunit, partial [Salinivirgaceae bacterium]|nr:efflux RND transporter periplasmic adaptor subunit [Salinivirgaceae bacterium]
DFVKKGDLVGQIDIRDYAIQLSVAQAEYEKVTAETGRVVELYKRNGVTEADYQKAVAGEKMITAQLNHAKDQINDTKLFAPFSGYIQTLNFEEGEIVNIGMPIASLIDVNSYHVEVDIPASLYVARDKFADFVCKLNLPNSKEMPLKLLYTPAKANSSQLYRLVLQLNPKIDERVSPGMEVVVLINYDISTERRCCVPLNAVFDSAGKSYVWNFNQADSIVSKVEVVTGDIAGRGNVLILSGLKGDETIVVAGVSVLNEGEKVEVIKPVSETNIGGLL